MGYEVHRIQETVDDELICPICSCVLEEPLQCNTCEHAFCRACITEWLHRQQTCPVDRRPLTTDNLRIVPRIMRNLLARLSIKCDNAPHGCLVVTKLDALQAHVEDCVYNPKRPLLCDKGCGFMIPKDELKNHNCVSELRDAMEKQQQVVDNLKLGMAEQHGMIAQFRQEIQIMSCEMRTIRQRVDRDDIINWSNSLKHAQVRRWGGMISTPEYPLQLMVRRALCNTNCPHIVLERLMENCHERNWPRGLGTLETRQNNRLIYDNYICRRVPNKQAIVILSCDNTHMSNAFIVDPGIIMIFAHGVE